ncbi:MAG: signal recognition particle-docking protein FtsY [Halioglobus sp.]
MIMKFFKRKKPVAAPLEAADDKANQPTPDTATSVPEPAEPPQPVELALPDTPEPVKTVESAITDISGALKPAEAALEQAAVQLDDFADKTSISVVAAVSELENGKPAPEPALDSGSALVAPTATPLADLPPEDGFFIRIRRGLSRTSDSLFSGLGNLFLGKKEIDAELLEELESRLLMADVGVDATMDIIDSLTQRVSRKELTHPEALQSALREELLQLLKPCQQPLDVAGKKPYVILMVGVNGVGKTTTIGKLAKRYKAEGRSVMLAAGDTFRAAAVEQLQVWGERNEVPVIAQHTGADSASVLFDALQAAQARGVDVLIADTAGRLHNKDNLMEELKKVVRVMGKLDPLAPHEVMLVLDAGTGQNALAQATHFQKAVGVSGISLTKLDGTAKGGVIFAIAKKLSLPIRFIGVGESAQDLRPFDAEQFIDALFSVAVDSK